MATYGGDVPVSRGEATQTAAPASKHCTESHMSCSCSTSPAVAAMQDSPRLPPDAAAGTTYSVAAEDYVCRLVTELSAPFSGSNANSEALLLLRQRPRAAGFFPADVTTALNELEELHSEGSAPLAALDRDVARRWREKQERALRDAWDGLLFIDKLIEDADTDVGATCKRLYAEEAGLMATMDIEELFRLRSAAHGRVLAKKAALAAQPELPPPSKEEVDLVNATTHRYNQIIFALLDFLSRDNGNSSFF
uniref:Uncharacterized protein n=1 Tax=Oryza brachyantha TaxID=4533 RepID=J3NDC0_ORYBR